MAQLPADRSKLALAQSNQTPSAVASSQRNKDAITEAYDTIDMLHGFTQTQLGFKYSKAETDALLLANKTGDHAGTWQGYTPSQASASIVQQNLDALKADTTQRAINVKSAPYNAKGDGVTDDTAAIQSAFNQASTYGSAVHFPEGTYLVTSAITITRDILFYGASQYKTIIQAGNGVVNLFEAKSPDYVQTQARFTMKNIQLSGLGTTAQRGIYIQAGKNIRIEECWFNGFQKEQLYLDQCFDSTIEKTYFYNATNTGTEPLVRLYYGTIDNVNEIHFNDCVFEKFARPAIRMESGAGTANSVNEIYFANCKWESTYVTNHIEMIGTVNVFFSNYNFCMARTNSATPVYGILMDGCKYIQMTNGFVEWFQTGTYEQPFVGMKTNSKGINILNTFIQSRDDANYIPPIFDIDTTTLFVNIMGTYREYPEKNPTNISFLNYFTKNINVRADSDTPSVILQRSGDVSKTIKQEINSVGRYRIVDGSTEKLAIDETTGRLVSANGILVSGTWNNANLLLMGSYRLWVDSTGRLRIKLGAPTSDTDGTIVGVQV